MLPLVFFTAQSRLVLQRKHPPMTAVLLDVLRSQCFAQMVVS